jgi:membrane protein required for colicin V production
MHSLEMMNWVDYSIIGIMAISILIGLARGFVREAMSLITWVTALILGALYCETVAVWFSSISVQGIRLILAFILIVLSTLIVGGIISYLIGHIIRSTKFGVPDRIIGTLFGFVRGAVIVAVISLVINSTFIAQESFWKASTLISHFEPVSVLIKEKLPQDLINKIYPPINKVPEM